MPKRPLAQVHYNTLSSTPVADRSVIEVATARNVEREATMLTALDLGWVTNGALGAWEREKGSISEPEGQDDSDEARRLHVLVFFLRASSRLALEVCVHRGDHEDGAHAFCGFCKRLCRASVEKVCSSFDCRASSSATTKRRATHAARGI